jgi:DNA-binding CsgD family transcriptional regulator
MGNQRPLSLCPIPEAVAIRSHVRNGRKQLDELKYRVTELLGEPGDKEESRPHELSLREALMVTCVYLRKNIIEDVWTDIFDGSVPRAYLLWAAAALLLEVIADDAPGDPDASALTIVRDLGLAEPDRALFPALIRVALGLSERPTGHSAGEAALAAEVAGVLGEAKRSAPPSGGPAWLGERLTESETRVLRYLPTHLGVPEIAAELYLSANTVRTHLRHLYRKLGAHSRQEAVQRARAIGLLTGSSLERRPAGPAARHMKGGRSHGLRARRT